MNQGTFNILSDVLKKENKIIIPDLQRDYCWGTVLTNHNKKSLAYNFTNELIKEAENKLKYKEFSYGIIYTYEYPKSFLYLCDGQQRLTTLYLILGVLNCYQQNEKLSDLLQFKNGQPRLKYEVRNTTDYFINNLVNLTFKNKNTADLEDVSKTSWFRDNYKDDPSIKNAVIALKDISNLINQSNFETVTDFILNKIGFVYINLEAKEEGTKQTYSKIREYGEKMYEIVNTCGDPMEPNEYQKSILLSKIPVEKKKEWTSKWEIWQDFFWVNKGFQLSADEGFNEFLSWIKKIEATGEYSIEVVEEYFKAFFLLITIQEKLLSHRSCWIKNLKDEFERIQKPNLMVLYPSLIYLKNSTNVKFNSNKYYVDEENVNYDEVFRYIRFFSNISRNTETIDTAIKLAKDNGNCDVVNFIKIQSDEYKSILTTEEIHKLIIYVNCQDNSEREHIENKIWSAEDENYLNGKISPLFKWMNIIYPNSSNGFKLSDFEKTYQLFTELVNKKNIDKLSIAMLVYSENFSEFREGSSWGCERFYLGVEHDFTFWRKWIPSKQLETIIEIYSNNIKLDEIISLELNKQTDITRQIIIRFLFTKASGFWQWNNTKRYFIHGKEICFPNGVQAKENTVRNIIF
ncbi:DUF262 domain-containing protein [Flavobacterium geliluteum]|uniref:DUF262 domain-containing protein n=1 Tax=Flavobacterium geliluteum TaxID=2816120 RepID=A0A941AY86_9FLAO|nr:DUF262 domain-containing protein [Flavobacterium geliluteum]MBP4140050.1 DUF262 domain-containing protein [Flavobacterium geliluteum]